MIIVNHENAIEKIRMIAAEDYAQHFGMSLIEAFVRTALSYAPTNMTIEFDINAYLQQRAIQQEEERWVFDLEVLDALKHIFRNQMHLDYPDTALTHMFLDDQTCEILLVRTLQHESARSERSN